MKRYSISLILRGKQIWIIMKCHLTVKVSIIKRKRKEISTVKNVEKLEILCSVGRNQKWYSLYGKLKIELPYAPAFPLWRIHLKELKLEPSRDICLLQYLL
jgi:hypothetical protein